MMNRRSKDQSQGKNPPSPPLRQDPIEVPYPASSQPKQNTALLPLSLRSESEERDGSNRSTRQLLVVIDQQASHEGRSLRSSACKPLWRKACTAAILESV